MYITVMHCIVKHSGCYKCAGCEATKLLRIQYPTLAINFTFYLLAMVVHKKFSLPNCICAYSSIVVTVYSQPLKGVTLERTTHSRKVKVILLAASTSIP